MDRTKYKIDREKFKTGCIAVFKRWTAFRMALDQNPQILRYITKNNTIEINDFLEILYDDILTTITEDKYGGKMLIEAVAECLNYFIGDYFSVELDDNSDFEVGEVLVNLYNELLQGKERLLNNLIAVSDKGQKYGINFPITGEQKNIPVPKDEDNKDDDGSSCESCEDEEEDDKKESKKNNKKKDNKMEVDGPDDDGFVVVKKGKGF